MKFFHLNRKLTVIFLSALLFGGCKEIQIETSINTDGSLTRTISIYADSSSVFDSTFPIPADSSWAVEWKKDSSRKESGKVLYTAARTFESVAELNRFFAPDSARLKQICFQSDFEKRFRWFTTFYRYKETFKSINPFTRLPLSDYLSQEEMDLYFSENKDDADDEIEEKIDEWESRTVFEEFYFEFKRALTAMPDPVSVPENRIEENKELLYQQITDEAGGDIIEMADDVLDVLYRVLKPDNPESFRPVVEQALKQVEIKVEFIEKTGWDTYAVSVQMPGLIIDTNADEIEGSRVSWKVEAEDIFVKDYEMSAESRIVNRSIILLTILLVIGLFIALSFLALRKRSRGF